MAPGNGASMRARMCDEMVVRGTTAGVAAWDGEIVELHHRDGSASYDVRWAEDARVTLYFPGPDASIRHLTPEPHPASASAHASPAPDQPLAGGCRVVAR
ncbi:DUF1918 domain-containing protein [Streptomyces sp. NPDC050625]|uniref:DUF1918 domain-containing protein n=1 Tax=Streptomyces sp. NPDC050625 TaxID=3154629 RepID=UPI00341D56B4